MFRDVQGTAQGDPSAQPAQSSLTISGLSYKTAFKRELHLLCINWVPARTSRKTASFEICAEKGKATASSLSLDDRADRRQPTSQISLAFGEKCGIVILPGLTRLNSVNFLKTICAFGCLPREMGVHLRQCEVPHCKHRGPKPLCLSDPGLCEEWLALATYDC